MTSATTPLPTAARPRPLPAPHTPDDGPDGLEVRGDLLVLRRLRTADPDTVAGAARALSTGGEQSALAWARAALSVGARAISTAGATAGTDDLAARVDRLAERTAQAASASADKVTEAVGAATGPDGTVAHAVDTALRGLTADLARLVGAEDGPLRAGIGRTVDAATSDAARRVERALTASTEQVRAVLGPDAARSPLAALGAEVARTAEQTRRELGEQIAQVREAVAANGATAAVMMIASAKGMRFEDAVIAALADLAAPGDLIEATGATPGTAGAKKGDAVLTVAPPACHGLEGVRVVVECKDRQLSPAALARELDAAASNRGAVGALAVVRAGRMPGTAAGGILVLGPRRIAVAHEPGGDTSLLRAALHLVRAAAVEQALAEAAPSVDRAALASAVRQALADLQDFQKADRALAASRRGLDDLAKAVDTVRDRLTTTLTAATRLLGPGAP